MHRDQVDPGVSELLRGNELSLDHMNRPLDCVESKNSCRLLIILISFKLCLINFLIHFSETPGVCFF